MNGTEIPDAARVAIIDRALALSALTCRVFLEDDPARRESESLRQRAEQWLHEVGAWPALDAEEQSLLSTKVGSAPRKQITRMSWCTERLAVLAWFLSLFEIAADDRPVVAPQVANSLWFLHPDARRHLQNASVRARTEVAELERRLAEVEGTLSAHRAATDQEKVRAGVVSERRIAARWLLDVLH